MSGYAPPPPAPATCRRRQPATMVRLRGRLHDLRRRLEILEEQLGKRGGVRRLDAEKRIRWMRHEVLRALADQKSLEARAIVLPCELGCQR